MPAIPTTDLQTKLAANQLTAYDVARTIDHAILHPTITAAQATKDITSLIAYPLATICIKPTLIELAVEMLKGTPIHVCTVVGFPHGTTRSDVKSYETERAFAAGAVEIDMVIHTGMAIGGDWDAVRGDIAGVLRVVRAHNGILKVIIETDFLPDDAVKIRLCQICGELGVDFVKTSTGFGYVKDAEGRWNYRGATESDLRLLRANCPPNVGIKASGGVRTLDDALNAIEWGCTRIGAGSSLAILREAEARFGTISTNTNTERKANDGQPEGY